MIHQVVSEILVFRMGSTILEHPVSDLKYVNEFARMSQLGNTVHYSLLLEKGGENLKNHKPDM